MVLSESVHQATRTAALVGLLLVGIALPLAAVFAAARDRQPPASAGFKWVNEMPEPSLSGLRHATFRSPAMGVDVGYVVYLPPEYDSPAGTGRRYPVVYFLHGGGTGNENRSAKLATSIDAAIRAGETSPKIYVFVNGGEVGFHDYGMSLGETAFVKELIPHIDETYRTVRSRSARAVEGFSFGARAAGRLVFKYPDVFGSAVSIGGGHQHEKRIAENGGRDELQLQISLQPGNNSWDLPREYAARQNPPPVRVLVVVGSLDKNYDGNLDWTGHLQALGIPFSRKVVDGVAHNMYEIYNAAGEGIMKFHDETFAQAVQKK